VRRGCCGVNVGKGLLRLAVPSCRASKYSNYCSQIQWVVRNRADKEPMPGSELKAGSPTLLCCHFTRIHTVLREVREYEALLEEISPSCAVVSLECPLWKGSKVRIDCGRF